MIEPLTAVTLFSSILLAGYSAFSKIRIESDREFEGVELEIKRWLELSDTATLSNAESDLIKLPEKPSERRMMQSNASAGYIPQINFSASGGGE